MTNETRGVLLSQADCPPELEADFDRWYDEEHIPKRLELAEFTSAQRYHAVSESAQRHMVIYQMSDLAVLDSPAYDDIKRGSGNTALTQKMLGSVDNFTRYICRLWSDSNPELSHDDTFEFAFVVAFPVPEDRFEAFDDWYENDHLPILLSASGWERCRRYRVETGEPVGPTAFAVHELSDPAVLEGPERARARETEWRRRMVEQEPWFSQGSYALYRRR